MCNQTVGLIQTAMERAGIATVSISLLREVAEAIQPPRVLSVPFRFGYPLGRPNDTELQRQIILSALSLLTSTTLPVIEDFQYRESLG